MRAWTSDTNILEVAFSEDKKYARSEAAFQYDYGMKLKPTGIDLPDTYEVHFSNDALNGSTMTMVADDTGVAIPDELLLSGQPVYAWIYVHSGEDDGETVYAVTVPVIHRPLPGETQPTPVQHDAISDYIAQLNEIVGRAQDVEELTNRVWDTLNELKVSVETLEPGAEATGSFDEETATFSFGIPRGADGEKGEKGDNSYNLTDKDKQDIAAIVLSELPSASGVGF